jgi:hypothetical protein
MESGNYNTVHCSRDVLCRKVAWFCSSLMESTRRAVAENFFCGYVVFTDLRPCWFGYVEQRLDITKPVV